MTRHDWIVLGGIALSAFFTMAVVIFHAGQVTERIDYVEQRVTKVEVTVDDIQRRISRIEGYLGTGDAAHTHAVETLGE